MAKTTQKSDQGKCEKHNKTSCIATRSATKKSWVGSVFCRCVCSLRWMITVIVFSIFLIFPIRGCQYLIRKPKWKRVPRFGVFFLFLVCSCRVVLYCAMLCDVVSCEIVLCSVVFCCVLLCCVVSFWKHFLITFNTILMTFLTFFSYLFLVTFLTFRGSEL